MTPRRSAAGTPWDNRSPSRQMLLASSQSHRSSLFSLENKPRNTPASASLFNTLAPSSPPESRDVMSRGFPQPMSIHQTPRRSRANTAKSTASLVPPTVAVRIRSPSPSPRTPKAAKVHSPSGSPKRQSGFLTSQDSDLDLISWSRALPDSWPGDMAIDFDF